MCYSFDIFDTCLVRKCGEANNIFDILAERSFTKSVSKEVKRAFVKARLKASIDTWSDNQTIFDIYKSFEFIHPCCLPKEKILQLELDIEREMLCPVKDIFNLIDSLHAKNVTIIFISDMYLSSDFLKSILVENRLFSSGDHIFVSCEIGYTKASGNLFSYIHNKMGIPYNKWHHYGDNLYSDVKIPRKLGIHAHAVCHRYSPYQLNMMKCTSLYFQWGSMLAGISKCIGLQSKTSNHKDIVLDVIAPLFVAFTYRIMCDASKNGIEQLFFCSRDAYSLYRIALKMKSLFHQYIDVKYLYISRTSLYDGDEAVKMEYFRQIGLASKSKYNGIVDLRSSGKSLSFLNELLYRHNYKSVRGYFFEICSTDNKYLDVLNYFAELDYMYLNQPHILLRKVLSKWHFYELFFPLNNQNRTVSYLCEKSVYSPKFDVEEIKDFKLQNLDEYVNWRNKTIDMYADYFIQLGLYKYADDIFIQYCMPQLLDFFIYPHKFYLKSLSDFFVLCDNGNYMPVVTKSMLLLPWNVLRNRTAWMRGTLFLNLPRCIVLFMVKLLSRI